ncbi:MAG: ATP cone domain-containing protein [Planctomycetota bacterium]
MNLPRRIQKRDGREVPFELRKIGDAIDRSFQTAMGGSNRALADEIARAVALTLVRNNSGDAGVARAMDWIPTVSQIDELVERALTQTGRSEAARAYIERRENRAKHRAQIEIRAASPAQDESTSREIRASSGSKSEPWSKGRIVTALMMEAELSRALAEEIASAVEARVFASGLRRIHTSLLRELVDNELFSRGLESHLRQQTVIGIPKHDLRDGLRHGFVRNYNKSGPPDGDVVAWTEAPETVISNLILERYSLEEILPHTIADRHLAGDLHFNELGAPHKEHTLALSLIHDSALVPEYSHLLSNTDSLELAADYVRGLILAARQHTTGTLTILDFEPWIQLRFKGARRTRVRELVERVVFSLSLSREAGEVLFSLAPDSYLFPIVSIEIAKNRGVLGSLSRCRIGVCVSASPSELVHVLQALEAISVDAPSHVVREALPTLGVAAAGVRALGYGIYATDNDGALQPIGMGSSAVLNLPRCAYRVPTWNEGKLLEVIVGLVDDAIIGFSCLEQFLKDSSHSRPNRLRRIDRSYVISWVGLRECVRFVHDGTVDSRFCSQVVHTIRERARAAGQAKGLHVSVEPWNRGVARSRFEQKDAEHYPKSSVFKSADRVCYSEGSTLTPVAGIAKYLPEAHLLSALSGYQLPQFSNLEELWDVVECIYTSKNSLGELEKLPASLPFPSNTANNTDLMKRENRGRTHEA